MTIKALGLESEVYGFFLKVEEDENIMGWMNLTGSIFTYDSITVNSNCLVSLLLDQQLLGQLSSEDIGEGQTLLWSGGTQRREGVHLVLNSFVRKALLSFTPISSRLLRARIDGKHKKVTFLTYYAPTDEAKDRDKDDFYAVLSSKASSVPPHDNLIVIGDFNSVVANSPCLYDAAFGPLTVDALRPISH
ncbi:hypothetical protein QYM36_017933 [Artemia franciscana]|uniref:Endonuclease/exonuclease/phosphatase domain-containing protein n=1 Tax=Artemia franciscana TaxID=6661 RepID=A0AA88KRU8_ARTSF|nr:hypothetical protein QYM36_017933 [Artemia franciscana]